MRDLKVFIYTNGCIKRNLDASRMLRYFELNRCRVVARPKDADYIIFVTCSVVKSKEDESFQYIDKLKGCRGELIVAGCLPDIASERLKSEFKGRYFTTKNLEEIDNIFGNPDIKFSSIEDAHLLRQEFRPSGDQQNQLIESIKLRISCLVSLAALFIMNFRISRGFYKRCMNFVHHKGRNALNFIISSKPQVACLRIGHGCIDKCTYCSILKAVGNLKSKPVDLCCNEYSDLLRRGYSNFLIFADNVGAYGLDIGSSLIDLLERMSSLDGGRRVSWEIPGLHPKWLIKYRDGLLK